MLLRLDDAAMLTVFDDSGGAVIGLRPKLERIAGAVSELQLREIMVELAFVNLHLKERPRFYTQCDLSRGKSRIFAQRPPFSLMDLDMKVRGQLLHDAVKHALPHITLRGRTKEEVLRALSDGNLSFLFDDNGEFIRESSTPL